MKSIFNSTPRSRRSRPQQHEAQSEPQPDFFQPKLTINAPGDKYEQEADAVADKVVSGHGAEAPAVQRQKITAVQRVSLSTPLEDEKLSTAEGRMEKDKLIQEKPEIQRAELPKEEEKPVQKMDAPKEEEKPVQKMDAPKEEEKPVQKMDAPKEEEKPVQKMDAPKEEETPVQKMDAPKEEEKPVQKMDAPKAEEKPVQKMDAPKEEEKPVQKMDASKEEEKPVQKMDAPKEEEKPVQTKSQPGPAQASPNFSNRIAARKGQGSALPDNTRAQMEKGIGADFSKVHIHTDSEAAAMNDDIHAQAFTHGNDVYFNSGKYSPESTDGKRLLAHELTHVVQQGGGNHISDIQKGESPLVPRSSTVKELTLAPGKVYVVQASDVTTGDIWDNLSKKTGILANNLKIFNFVYKGFSEFLSFDWLPETVVGTSIYVPSGDDLAFYQYCLKNGFDYNKAVKEFGDKFASSEQRTVLNAGIDRTTGKPGENYGTVDPSFYSPNEELAGASSKRKEEIDGRTEYKISWGSDYWKCNIFVNDAVYQAGYSPANTENKHYKTAGALHIFKGMTQLEVSDALPGTIIQYYGGTGSDSSHNMILTSFISREVLSDGTENWIYTATGAESERAAESNRKYNVKPVFNDGYDLINAGWTKIRFFKPNTKK